MISLILSFSNRKVRRKREICEKTPLTTHKQNMACLTCDPSVARTHSGEIKSDLERLGLVVLTTRPRESPLKILMPNEIYDLKEKKSASSIIPPTYRRGERARRQWYHGPADYIAKNHCRLTFDRPLWYGDGTLYTIARKCRRNNV